MRAERSLIQTIGRAARNAEGKVIMYADKMTGSMERAIGETNRRRKIQMAYNEENGIIPKTIRKDVRDIIEIGRAADEAVGKGKGRKPSQKLTKSEREKLIAELTVEMKRASQKLEFEQAAFLRDKIKSLRNEK